MTGTSSPANSLISDHHQRPRIQSSSLGCLRTDDSSAVEAMVHHMYGFDYNSSGNDSSRKSPMLFNVKVYHIADKYDIPQLKDAAKEKFVKACWQMDNFPAAIAEVYKATSKTDEGLQDPLVTISIEQISQLQEEDGFWRVLEVRPDSQMILL